MMCLSALVFVKEERALSFPESQTGVQDGTEGWACGVGAACQVWRRMRPGEVGVTLLMEES